MICVYTKYLLHRYLWAPEKIRQKKKHWETTCLHLLQATNQIYPHTKRIQKPRSNGISSSRQERCGYIQRPKSDVCTGRKNGIGRGNIPARCFSRSRCFNSPHKPTTTITTSRRKINDLITMPFTAQAPPYSIKRIYLQPSLLNLIHSGKEWQNNEKRDCVLIQTLPSFLDCARTFSSMLDDDLNLHCRCLSSHCSRVGITYLQQATWLRLRRSSHLPFGYESLEFWPEGRTQLDVSCDGCAVCWGRCTVSID